VNTPYAILVHKDNPIKGLTLQQLDGIFGAERDGGWVGTTWHPEYARGKEGNIRTWGDLGLGGEWKDKPINTHGYTLRYMFAPRFSDDVLMGSDKWNENLRQYVSYMRPDGKSVSPDQQLADAIGKDRYGIAYFTHTRGANAQTRLVPMAAKPGEPYVELNLDTARNRTYPLVDSMFLYYNRKPGTALDPKVKEFLRYVLSREGQEQVALDTTMLPLTREFLLEQRRKLD
jgi:phosphate transport system substrate-binding protein